MLIAQISDLHIRPPGQPAYGVSETNLDAEHAIYALLRLDPPPDCLLVSGDLTDCGLEEEYAIASTLFARLPFPVFCVPGNHDRREGMRAAFAQADYLPAAGPLDFCVDRGGLRIIGLDSLVPGQSHGALVSETLDFLRESLEAAPQTPTLVMLHHPPFMTGIGHMDRQALKDGAVELEAIIAAHPQVERVLCGHVHRSIQRRFGGTICQAAPSVTHQVALDLREEAPSAFVLEPRAFLLHRFDGTGIVTHTAHTDRAAGPFPFILPRDYPRNGGVEIDVRAD